MEKTARFVIWICSKFTREEIEEIIQGLLDVLANRNPEVRPKDDFKEKHPHYRNFFVDPNSPPKYLKVLPAKLVVLLASIFTLTMVEDAPSLSVRSHLPLSQVHPRHRSKAKYFCPHCGHPPSKEF